jgi:hypothetical protein
MCRGAGKPILTAMNGTPNRMQVVVGLELDEATDVVTGQITTSDGAVTEFRGWVGLLATLDEMVCSRHDAGIARGSVDGVLAQS